MKALLVMFLLNGTAVSVGPVPFEECFVLKRDWRPKPIQFAPPTSVRSLRCIPVWRRYHA